MLDDPDRRLSKFLSDELCHGPFFKGRCTEGHRSKKEINEGRVHTWNWSYRMQGE